MNKNYVYGAIDPTHNRESVLQQIQLAHNYRNKLVEIELQRRKETDETVEQFAPGLAQAEAAIAELDNKIDEALTAQKAENSRTRSKGRSAIVKELRSQRKEVYAQRKQLRTTGFESADCKAVLLTVNDRAAAAVRDARAKCGVFWGTYLLIEQAAEGFRKGAPPNFERFHGEGRIGIQLQGGMSWQELLEGDSRQLQLIPAERIARVAKSGKKLQQASEKTWNKRFTLRIRIGSENRDPVWAEFPVIIHRPVPIGASIKWAIVSMQKIAGKERWSLMLVLSGDASVFSRDDMATDGACGVDVGYRLMPDGSLRVAYVVDESGNEFDMRIPAGKIGQFKKVEDIQSIRDQLHNEAKSALMDWLGARSGAPEWMGELSTIHLWKTPSRLARLVREWSSHVDEDSEAILGVLQAWRKQELHLWQYQENLRDQLHAWRKDLYRNFARSLARKYQKLCVEDLDLRKLHDVIRPKDEQVVPAAIRWSARTACLSSLLQCLKEAASEFRKVAPENTTRIHFECGGLCNWDQASSVTHCCEHCGEMFDQDSNGAKNILARGAGSQN